LKKAFTKQYNMHDLKNFFFFFFLKKKKIEGKFVL